MWSFHWIPKYLFVSSEIMWVCIRERIQENRLCSELFYYHVSTFKPTAIEGPKKNVSGNDSCHIHDCLVPLLTAASSSIRIHNGNNSVIDRTIIFWNIDRQRWLLCFIHDVWNRKFFLQLADLRKVRSICKSWVLKRIYI